jgi:hypothetical protein
MVDYEKYTLAQLKYALKSTGRTYSYDKATVIKMLKQSKGGYTQKHILRFLNQSR